MNANLATNKLLTDRPHPKSGYHASPLRSVLACGGTIEDTLLLPYEKLKIENIE